MSVARGSKRPDRPDVRPDVRRDPVVCTCLTVRESEIRSVIRAGANSIAEVGERCEAGTGCHTCHPAIFQMLEEQVHRDLAAGRAPEPLLQLGLFEGATKRPGPGGAARKPGEPRPGPAQTPDEPDPDQPDSAE